MPCIIRDEASVKYRLYLSVSGQLRNAKQNMIRLIITDNSMELKAMKKWSCDVI